MTPDSRKFAALAGAVALANGLMAGCSAGGERGAAPTVSIAATPQPLTSLSQIKVPLETYVLAPEEAAVMHNAIVIKANKCMLRFGVSSTEKPNNVRMASDATMLEGRYSNTVSIDSSTRYGYQDDPRYALKFDKEEKKDPNAPLPDPRELEAWEGTKDGGGRSTLKDKDGKPVPPSGCYGEGNAEVQGYDQDDRSNMIHMVSNGLDNATSRMDNDSRLLAADKKWSACMKTKGYAFAHKRDAADSVADKPQKQQIKVAVDDAICAQQSNYYGVMYALDVAYQNQYISEHQAELTASYNEVRKSLVTARAIVAKGE